MKRYVSVLGLGVLVLAAMPVVTAFLAYGFSAARVADGNDVGWPDSVLSSEVSSITLTPPQPHDVALEGCASEGSALVNLSDTVGAYVYVLCEAVNLGDHDDRVRITSGDGLVSSTLPAGCVAGGSLVIPGAYRLHLAGRGT